MRKYYLFVIRKEIYEIYKHRPESLFQTLKNLYTLDSKDFEYGISLYHQLCEPFDVKRLEDYMQEKYHLEKKGTIFLYKNNYLLIKPCRVIIKTNVNLPNIFLDFKCYNRLIFVVDFDFYDYFFLCDDYNYHKQREYL